jgi:hypothetical protein
VLQLAQQQGVDVNSACGPEGRTALHAAAQHGQKSCCSTLLELGADSYQYDARQVSALMLAAQQGHDTVLQVRSHPLHVYVCRPTGLLAPAPTDMSASPDGRLLFVLPLRSSGSPPHVVGDSGYEQCLRLNPCTLRLCCTPICLWSCRCCWMLAQTRLQ